MAAGRDEAVVRIVLQDQGRGATSSTTGTPATPARPSDWASGWAARASARMAGIEEAARQRRAEMASQQLPPPIPQATPSLPAEPPTPAFDFVSTGAAAEEMQTALEGVGEAVVEGSEQARGWLEEEIDQWLAMRAAMAESEAAARDTQISEESNRYLELEARAALDVAQRQQEAIEERERREQELLELEARVALDSAREQMSAAATREDRERKLLELEAKVALDFAKEQTAALEAREQREQELLELEARVALDFAKEQIAALRDREERERELLELEAHAALEVARAQQAAVEAREAADQELFEQQQEAIFAALEKQQRMLDEQQAAIEDARRAEVEREDRERELLELEARTYLDMVRKQQEAAILDAEEVFDPAHEARKRREREMEREQVEAEYKRLYGDDEEEADKEDPFLELIDSLRGTIGSLGGGILGPILDVVVAMRKASAAAEDQDRKKSALAGQEATQAVEAAGTPETGAADITQQFAPSQPQEGIGGAPFPGGRGGIPGMPGIQAPAANTAVGGGGGLGGAMAAAGPALAIVAAVKAAVDAVNSAVIGGIRAVVGGASSLAAAFADPSADPSVPLKKLGDATSEAGEKIAEVSPALGWMTVAVGEVTRSVASLMQAIDKTAERYGEFSPQIAQAQAVAEIRQMMGDFRRAQTVGNELSQYLVAQADLQQKFEDIKVRFLAKILPIVTRILELLEAAMPAGDGIENAVSGLTAPLELLAKIAADLLNTQRDDRQKDVEDPTDQILMSDRFLGGGAAGGGDWVPKL